MDEQQKAAYNPILQGSIAKQQLIFFFPIWFGTFFQQLYNTADALIVGNFVGTEALAAVGATNTLVNLLVGFFVGLSSGAAVVLAQRYGARDGRGVQSTVHTSIGLAVVGGLVLMAVGLVGSRAALQAMNTPEDIMEDALVYLRVYFVGMVPSMIYNMGTGVLRAIGDSRRPTNFLIAASVANIVLDLLFVAVFHWGVFGAALATILSQVLSAALTLACLAGAEAQPYQLHLRAVRIEGRVLADIVRIGLPAGLQSVMYSVSNVIIQASINGFGTTTVAAWTVYGKLDSIFWMTMNSLGLSVTTFSGQNFGARQYDRVKKGAWATTGFCAGMSLALGALILLFGAPLVRLFTQDPLVLERTLEIIRLLAPCYITYAAIEAMSGAIRGAGDAWVPMALTAGGVCGLRVLWVLWVAPGFGTLTMVLLSYPISWGVTSLLFIAYFLAGGWLRRCIRTADAAEKTAAALQGLEPALETALQEMQPAPSEPETVRTAEQ